MFPLREKITTGYSFLEPTFYNNGHLGQDYRCSYAELVAPFEGEIIKSLVGIQGGLTQWFRPKSREEVIRFLHLNEFKKTGKVFERDLIAITGNSGSATRGEHLHIDIARSEQLLIDFLKGKIKNPKKVFIDPEKYDWDLNINDIIMEFAKADKRICQVKDGSIYVKDNKITKYYIINDSNSTDIERLLLSLHKGENRFYDIKEFEGLERVYKLKEVL